jgi:site-specific recombinase XerD
LDSLTLLGTKQFAAAYSKRSRSSVENVFSECRIALRAWSHALRLLGYPVPAWTVTPKPARLPRIVQEFVAYRRTHAGIASSTERHEAKKILLLVAFLKKRKRDYRRIRLQDIDEFVLDLSTRLGARSVIVYCGVIRSFLRFLHTTGRLQRDLAGSVIHPVVRSGNTPPRALPWRDVVSILAAIDKTTRIGKRDVVLLLMMATYGMGAAEVLGLTLDDVDWKSRALRVRRPKTGVSTQLPLLPPIAKALAQYLQLGRPPHAETRAIFVSTRLPHLPLTIGGISNRLLKYAALADVRAVYLGTHTLRHSHARRQIEEGAHLKVVSDILGHRRPSSMSPYAGIATSRLRALALPVPR